jgi:hypothetical protein
MLVDHASLVFDARNELSMRSVDSVVTL